jgi:hypothetical protein
MRVRSYTRSIKITASVQRPPPVYWPDEVLYVDWRAVATACTTVSNCAKVNIPNTHVSLADDR